MRRDKYSGLIEKGGLEVKKWPKTYAISQGFSRAEY